MPISFAGPPDDGTKPIRDTGGSPSSPIHRSTRLALSSLDNSVQQFYAAGLAPSTKATYKAGQLKFIKFCVEYNIKNVLPVNQDILCYYVAFLGREGLAHSTIKGYLSALRNLQITYGFPSPFDSPMPKLDQILR